MPSSRVILLPSVFVRGCARALACVHNACVGSFHRDVEDKDGGSALCSNKQVVLVTDRRNRQRLDLEALVIGPSVHLIRLGSHETFTSDVANK